MTDLIKEGGGRTAYLHARAFVLMVLFYVVVLEVFNLFPLPRNAIVFLTLLPPMLYGYALYRHKIWQNIWFPVSFVFLIVVVGVGAGSNFLIHDSVNYHLPKIIMQAASGSLGLSEGPTWQMPSTIALTDNIAMLFMITFKSERALLIPNLFCFFFVVFQGLSLLGQKRWPAIAIFLILLAAAPSVILETSIFKPNILAPAALLLCLGTFCVRMAENKFVLRDEYIFFGVAAALLVLAKVTAFLAVMPACVAISVYALYKGRENLARPLKIIAISAAASIALLLPYIIRQYAFYGSALVAEESAVWSILPPNVGCAFYYWPQHFMWLLKFGLGAFGHDLTANITPSECWANRNEYNEIRPLWYGHDLGVWLIAVALLVRHRWTAWTTTTGILIMLAITLPMTHAMFYANSIYNSRMVGFDLVMIAFALAYAVGPTIRWFDLVIPTLISSYVVLASFAHTGGRLDVFEKHNSRFEASAETMPSGETVRIGYYAKGHSKEAWSISFALLSIFDFYGYNARKVDFVYVDDFLERGNITHLLLCSRSKDNQTAWPKHLDEKYKFSAIGCRVQQV